MGRSRPEFPEAKGPLAIGLLSLFRPRILAQVPTSTPQAALPVEQARIPDF